MRSNIGPSYLDEATVADAASLPISDLASLDADLAEQAEVLGRRKAKLRACLERRFGDDARAFLASKGADTGTAHCEEDGWDVSVTIPKKVVWDQEKLLAALDRMSREDAKHYAKLTVSVEETKYKAAPPAVRALLEPARTMTPGNPSFSFKQLEEEAA